MHQVPAIEFMINQSTGKYIVEIARHHTRRDKGLRICTGDGGLQRGVEGSLLRPQLLPPTLSLLIFFFSLRA